MNLKAEENLRAVRTVTDSKGVSRRIMLTGAVDAGKTTLMKALFRDEHVSMEKDKTQSMDYDSEAIDTPGEFTALPYIGKGALLATSLEADLILFLHDATTGYIQFPPGFAIAFPRRSIGVVTKIDHPDANVKRGVDIIRNVCVSDPNHIFCVSAKTGEGIRELREYIDKALEEGIRYRV